MPVESEEKEFTSFALFSPSRPPLNSIPDPSQLQKKATHLSGFELAQKFQGRGGGAHPRIVNRNARSRSEPNSSLVRYYMKTKYIFFCEALVLYENNLHCCFF